MGKGEKKSETSKQAQTRTTKAAVDRRQNNKNIKAVSVRYCAATTAPHNCCRNCYAEQNHKDNVGSSTVGKQLKQKKSSSQAQLHLPALDLFWASFFVRVQLTFFLISPGLRIWASGMDIYYIFLCIIFNACFSTNTVPTTWKTACILPIPKRLVISSMNDLRPVALTSAVMKVCERVGLCKLEKLIKDYMDPLQFAYRKNGSTDDAVLYSLENIYSHLEKTGSTVRLMFFDFSSAFNTIQPHLLVQKPLNMKLPSSVISWIFDYLTNRLQDVRLTGLLSSAINTNTGAPQGIVLAPYLFALYTADCRSTDEPCPLVKFADDTELVGKISDDEDAVYHKQIESFVNRCDTNYLYFNVSKTKEMCINFRKNQKCPKPVYIKGEVERVEAYKYLGVVFL